MPPSENLAAHSGTLSSTKQQLLERLRQGKSHPGAARIPRRAGSGPAPLSFAQQRLWFLEQLLPRTGVYTEPAYFLLSGDLDVRLLERCLREIVQRHAALRTTFPQVDGHPVQRVAAEQPFTLGVEELPEAATVDRQAAVLAWLRVESRHAFDVASGPLFRVRLLRLAEQEHLLVLNTHHIIVDTWSIAILIRELAALYRAFARSLPSPLPALALEYPDFTVWQRERLRGPLLERDLTYWKKKLGAVPPAIDLLGDRPRPPLQAYRGNLRRRVFAAELSERLKKLSQQEGCTLFMTLLAAFNALLARYTRQQDFLVGSTIAGRPHPDLESLIGFFANTVVLRADLGGDPTFRELLHRVRATSLEASDHQELPFERLVEEWKLSRDMSHNPLFQVMFVLQNVALPTVPLDDGLTAALFEPHTTGPWAFPQSGLVLDPLDAWSGTSKFDLWLSMAERGDALVALLEYNTDLFADDTIERMLGHFQTLLESAVRDPGRRLSELTLMAEAERRQVVLEWNATAVRYPEAGLLHGLVEARVARSPDATAVVFESQHLTYGELNRRANRLAHRLRALGVGPDLPVGICAERSFEMVVGLLGILKAGGAWLPLDPGYPRERLAFMLEDSRVGLLLTQRHLVGRFPGYGKGILFLEDEPAEARPEWDENPRPDCSSDHLSYVIYTSGSTGLPKGAMNTHRGIANRILWMQGQYALTPDDRVLQKTPFSFDVSVWEFFWPLMAGARVILARPEGHKDATYLARLIREQEITTLHFVPSMLQAFLEEPEVAGCRSVRQVISSGEALSLSLQDKFHQRMGAALHNLYGPTEASVDVTFWACQPHEGRLSVPIGRPIANTQIYLLDDRLNPVPIGVPGELYIGGVGVARGYLHRPELTAQRFIPDPFHPDPGARLYRTGDLARYAVDGAIEFLGRLDEQVKINGFRIELGEVEAALRRQPGVKDAIVVARAEQGRDPRLVAYVVPDPAAELTEGEPLERLGQTEKVRSWAAVFDQAYSATPPDREPDSNFLGWNDSYTGAPLSADVMREWAETTAARILSLAPSRVLEIGCGTGLLLYRIAPHCAAYHGTDISREAVQQIEATLSDRGLRQVQVSQRPAHVFDGVEPGAYDLVILNSVVQYFPSIDYLLRVLEGVCRALGPGGTLFIGDVRSLPMLELLHTSVELAKAGGTRSVEHLRRQIQLRVAQENELVLDPAFFSALRHRLPRLGEVRVLLKRGRHHNELTRFRYDVILRLGGAPGARSPASPADAVGSPIDCRQSAWTVEGIRHHLESQAPEAFALTHVGNARLSSDRRAFEALAAGQEDRTVDQLRQKLAAREPSVDIDPEALFALADELGYEAYISWSEGREGRFDATFCRRGASRPAQRQVDPLPWQHYANNPFREQLSGMLIPRWKGALKERLPEFMLPSTFVLLEQIPINPNGKADRAALPPPAPTLPELEASYVAPRSAVERTLAGVWAEVLALESVGIHNNFFALGGDSIRSILVVSRARAAGLHLTVQQLFQHRTIAELAPMLGSKPPEAPTRGTAFESIEREAASLLSTSPDLEDVFPASPFQAYMLRQLQEHPEPGLYVLFAVMPMPSLDVDSFARAWQALIDRHPALRTSFATEGWSVPVQLVHRQGRLPLEQYDWTGLPEPEQERALLAYIEELRKRGYDLGQRPQMRMALFRVGSDAYQFLFSFNYLQHDGWSTMILLKEWQDLYEAHRQGRAPATPQAASLRAHLEWVHRQSTSKAEAFWRRGLAGFHSPTPLIQRLGGPGAGEGFTKQHVYLDRATTRRLDALCRDHSLTLSTLVQGAWTLLLRRYTGEQDVVFGVVVSGRSGDVPGTEDTVGLMNNLVPMRPPVSARSTTRKDWLSALQASFLEIRQYEYSALDQVKGWSEVPPDQRLFESYIVFENMPVDDAIAGSLDPATPLSLVQLDIPLRLEVWPGPRLLVIFQYHRRHFTDAVVSRLLRDFEATLTSLLDTLDAPP